MISHVEELSASQESVIEQCAQRRFDIEWVNSSQSNQARISRDMGVGSVLVDCEDIFERV